LPLQFRHLRLGLMKRLAEIVSASHTCTALQGMQYPKQLHRLREIVWLLLPLPQRLLKLWQ
jgi:hypothetical protein